MDVRGSLIAMFSKADRAGALGLLEQWAEENGYERLVREVLEPVLKDVGLRWEREGFSLVQAYVAAKVSEDIMEKMVAERVHTGEETETRGTVVLGNIEDDFHALGRRMVVTFLETDGWLVYDLGNDVPADEFVDKALEVEAKVIGASAMMYTTAENIKKLRTEIDRRGLTGRIQLAVGGAVFVLRPGLVEEVGGDGTAANAIDAPTLFRDLWERARQGEDR